MPTQRHPFMVHQLIRDVRDHRLLPHAYADDTQILGVCRPSETDELQ